ncbi:hypothetical protein BJX99DRAFT_256455 [Aspergillus californicus]
MILLLRRSKTPMPRIEDLAVDGPYGGQEGSSYDARHNEQRIQRIDAWSADYQGYIVFGALQFVFNDGTSSDRIGGRNPNIECFSESFDFKDNETIESIIIYRKN